MNPRPTTHRLTTELTEDERHWLEDPLGGAPCLTPLAEHAPCPRCPEAVLLWRIADLTRRLRKHRQYALDVARNLEMYLDATSDEREADDRVRDEAARRVRSGTSNCCPVHGPKVWKKGWRCHACLELEACPTPAARILRRTMAALSEDRWCAGWHTGLEFTLWAELEDPAARSPDVDELRMLAAAAGGWVAWDETRGLAAFVPMAEWLARFAAHAKAGTASAESSDRVSTRPGS